MNAASASEVNFICAGAARRHGRHEADPDDRPVARSQTAGHPFVFIYNSVTTRLDTLNGRRQQMSGQDARQQEIDQNFKAFRERLPEILAEHGGKFALMRHAEIVEYFDTARDAMVYGQKEFVEDGLFSVQEVTERVVDLGFFSHAMHDSTV